jgi:hypothetical protein
MPFMLRTVRERASDARCRAHYDRLRQRGHEHARALRGVVDRSFAVLIAMLTSRTLYEPYQRSKETA